MRLSWPFGPPVMAAPQPAAEVRRPCGCLIDPLVFGHLCQGETLSRTYGRPQP